MVCDVIQATVDKIKEHYPNAKIYDTEVKQGLIMPCFFVSSPDLEEFSKLRNIYEMQFPIHITYIVDDKQDDYMSLINDCKGKFSSSFTTLTTREGSMLHVKKKTIEYDSVERLLRIFFEVRIRCYRKQEGDKIYQVIWKGVSINETK
ncbi:MAG: hypothetical protein RR565_09695 [Erysipelothrix sp.]